MSTPKLSTGLTPDETPYTATIERCSGTRFTWRLSLHHGPMVANKYRAYLWNGEQRAAKKVRKACDKKNAERLFRLSNPPRRVA